jgi:hypothetical protein
MNKTVALVACVSKKNDRAMAAKDLYISDLFQKASTYAKQNSDVWYILSAKYGLLNIDAVISPYDVTLKQVPVRVRRQWAAKVLDDLEPLLKAGDEVIILAGTAYREFIVGPIEKMGCSVVVPMEGLGIGEQLRWLKEHTE